MSQSILAQKSAAQKPVIRTKSCIPTAPIFPVHLDQIHMNPDRIASPDLTSELQRQPAAFLPAEQQALPAASLRPSRERGRRTPACLRSRQGMGGSNPEFHTWRKYEWNDRKDYLIAAMPCRHSRRLCSKGTSPFTISTTIPPAITRFG